MYFRVFFVSPTVSLLTLKRPSTHLACLKSCIVYQSVWWLIFYHIWNERPSMYLSISSILNTVYRHIFIFMKCIVSRSQRTHLYTYTYNARILQGTPSHYDDLVHLRLLRSGCTLFFNGCLLRF